MADDIAKKRIEKLTDKGFRFIEKGSYREALEVADQLEWERGPFAFYIAGQARAGLNDIKRAAAVMRRGVLIRPDVWWNWYFLGVYLHGLEKNDEALAAYHQALLCPGVDADAVRLNMATLSVHCKEYDAALTYLDSIEKPSTRWCTDGSRVLALEGVGRFAEAMELAEKFLRDRPERDEEYDKRVGFVVAALARIRLRQGWSKEEVHEYLMQSLEEHVCSGPILTEIRNLNPRYHKEAKRFRIVIGATLPIGHPWRREAGGYGILYDVVSVSLSEAVNMIHDFESRIGVGTLQVLESQVMEERPEDPLGVYLITERIF